MFQAAGLPRRRRDRRGGAGNGQEHGLGVAWVWSWPAQHQCGVRGLGPGVGALREGWECSLVPVAGSRRLVH